MSVKIHRDLRESFGGARDQGQRPTCLAFAASDAHAAARNTKPFEALSVEYLFYHAVLRTRQKDPHRGITLQTAAAALEADGQPTERVWPYLIALPTDLTTWKPPHSTEVHHTDIQHKQPTAGLVRESIDKGQPLLAVLRLSESFYRPNSQGVIELQNPDPDTSAHAVVVVGYGVLDGAPMILIRNSWGTQWGMNGYAWVYERYALPRLHSIAAII
jgi:C1A family cysteine protease